MSFFGKLISNISQAYSEINPATLTGAIDVIIVEQEDGSYSCSPFHVRFGKMGVIRSKEKIVDIEINGTPVDIHMKLGDSGEAYFLEQCEDDEEEEEDDEEEEEDDEEEGDELASPTSPTVQLPSNTKVDEASPNSAPPTCDLSTNDNHCDNDNVQPSSEAANGDISAATPAAAVVNPSKSSDSLTSANASIASDKSASSQKRYRRKKKNRASSKQSMQNAADAAAKVVATEQSESSCDRESTAAADDVPVSESSVNHQYADGELHPFSDSEVSTFKHQIYKKQESIDPYDCKSDSEYEMFKQSTSVEKPHDHDNMSWGWGELPNVQKETPSHSKKASEVEYSKLNKNNSKNDNKSPRSSMLGGVLGFIIKDKDTTEEDKGIYLDDLDPNDMNPEVAAKYFPKFANRSSSFSQPKSSNASDEDVESGTGPSLSNSPHGTEINYNTQPDYNEFDAQGCALASYDLSVISKLYHDMSMSLCGGVENLVENPSDTEHFLQSIISFDDFSESPLHILNNPNLVIRMGGRYYTWKMASAILLSMLMFQRPLPEKTLSTLKEQCIPKKKITAQNSTSSWRNWFGGSRSNPSESNPTSDDGASNGQLEGGSAVGTPNGPDTRSLNSTSSSSEDTAKMITKSQSNNLEYTSDEETMNIVLSSNKSSNSSSTPSTPGVSKKAKFRKVLRLKTDVIKSLNLKRNCNEVMFSVTTAFQGTTICRSKIFLWRYDDKVVISDIDGTITKSDVLGHILPYIGKDWAQVGVAQLYSNIENNGYKFLYLSARAIGQAKTTRDYLRALRQDDIGLPDGPLLLSPTSLFSALHREVIEKKPEEFKISCLTDIRYLFPENPFFAGFGNKINDNWAYKAVGIDSSRIFTINPRGELKLEKIMSFKSSYTDLSQFVDQMFPPLQQQAYYDGYSSFLFWRSDIPELDDAEINAKDG